MVSSDSLTGCANYHARIRFDDAGIQTWLLRVPRVTGFAVSFPVPLAEYLIRSEYATLILLETPAVPAPRAFSFGIPSQGADHGVGVCFLLMEELPGKPWDGRGDPAKIWSGLAGIYAELGKHPFSKAGSLSVERIDDPPLVSAVASDRFVCLDPYDPFDSAATYYARLGRALYPQFPANAYLVYLFLRDGASATILFDDSSDNNEFFLRHVDDKGDHLLVDGDCNITGIIDW
ncbi:hypothetical protein B0H66DRAFT_644633 [Apodospora peruviana]|uniref:Aminoglycoside phosphotransferase domain-containing protein n=1 Tax=Apodospora peruviana TaxID=516989 RepID=A0AAE0HUX1_9PEZI|nr:hypothetical protein B0H66DRAFT_644633 [Apodospora peruviana]